MSETAVSIPPEPPAREVAHTIQATEVEFLAEPFELYKTDSGFWKNPQIVVNLMVGFRLFSKASRAYTYAKITHEQYYYFLQIHPHFSMVIERIKSAREIDRISKINKASDWRAQAYLLEKESPEEFGKQGGPNEIPPGGSRATLVNESIMDESGKIVASRQSLELLKDHGNDAGNNQ